MWVEHHGELQITNLKNGDNCNINFKKCGFFGNGVDCRVEGFIQNSEGERCVELTGSWDEYLQGTWLVETKDTEVDKTVELWRIQELNFINDKYHLSRFAATLIELDDELRSILPPTDSRLRLDKEQLVIGDLDTATKCKKMMEERQRQEKKKQENPAAKNGSPPFSIRLMMSKVAFYGYTVETIGSNEKKRKKN